MSKYRPCFFTVVVVVAAILVLIVVMYYSIFIFMRSELRGVSYNAFAKQFDTSDFDPKGAKDIWLASDGGRDCDASFMKMSIDQKSLDRLLKEAKQNWGSYEIDFFGTSRQLQPIDSMPGPPDEFSPPSWWQPDGILLFDRSRQGERRAYGEIWFYDARTMVLWRVDWSLQ